MDSSSDDGSKNEQAPETNWSLSSFVKPDPKPVEKLVPQVKKEPTGDLSNNSNAGDLSKNAKKSFASPKCFNEQIKQEPIGKRLLLWSYDLIRPLGANRLWPLIRSIFHPLATFIQRLPKRYHIYDIESQVHAWVKRGSPLTEINLVSFS